MVSDNSIEERAGRYCRIKYSLAAFGLFYSLLLIFTFLLSGASGILELWLMRALGNKAIVFLGYLILAGIAFGLLSFPLTFCQGFILEHNFSLSRQRLGSWLIDQLKSGLLSYVVTALLLGMFYFILAKFPYSWWLVIWLAWAIFNVIFTKLVPVLVIPLFFKYKAIDDRALRDSIFRLAAKMKITLLDVFEIDFSKKTLKANAAFVGVGATKRVLLADTLRDKYALDEVEVILAHEFAHYRLRHLLKLVCINCGMSLLLFYLISRTNQPVLAFFGFGSLSQISAMPVLFAYFILFGILEAPLVNFISRGFERSADRLSIEATGNKEAFISAMNKLARQNLADRFPHPLVKFFFFDHPPISERIKIAEGK